MAEWQCSRCGDTEATLHVHHKVYRRGAHPADYPDVELEVLCWKCHRDEHAPLGNCGRFAATRPYHRSEIARVLGGDVTGFLPMHDGHVVCGCFRKQYNPDAPDIILPGDLRRITEPAEMFCRQSFPVPIFLHDNEGWWYSGDYAVSNWTANAREIELHTRRSGRTNGPPVSRVMFLKPSEA